MTPTEQEKLESILQLLGGCVYRRRIMLKPYFYDKDQCRSGKVSYTRFRSILDFLNLKLTEEQFQILTKRFSHQAIEFNYLTFCEVLAKYSDS
jgi:Ca2+-binding EF-hand superfamily protein